MSSQASNGRGSVVATIGLFIVLREDIGAAVERNRTVPRPVVAGGTLCQTTPL